MQPKPVWPPLIIELIKTDNSLRERLYDKVIPLFECHRLLKDRNNYRKQADNKWGNRLGRDKDEEPQHV